MDERIHALLRQQSEWQASRKALSWEAKLRMIESAKDELARLLPAYRAGIAGGRGSAPDTGTKK